MILHIHAKDVEIFSRKGRHSSLLATGGISNVLDATPARPSSIATRISYSSETVLSFATIAHIAVALAETKSKIWPFSQETRHFAQPALGVVIASVRSKIYDMQGHLRVYFV